MSGTVLITGFEPYGGMAANPAHDAMRALHGETIEGFRIEGRPLPVSMARMRVELEAAIRETRPSAILCLGLCPGETAIRLERVGLNLADFGLVDNDGQRLVDTPLAGNGPPARWSTLPLRAIEQALLAAGTPARLSESAGTYLCNACLYAVLYLGEGIPAGFIHVPLTPEMAARRLRDPTPDADVAAPPATMEFTRIVEAVRLAIRETVRVTPKFTA